MGPVPTYAAFLRAVNLGATRRFPKAAIVDASIAAGCTDVETYINTGNVRVTTTLRSHRRVEAALEAAFSADRGFDVPTVAFAIAELHTIVADADDFARRVPVGAHFVSLSKQPASGAAAAALEGLGVPGEHAHVLGRVVHVVIESGSYHTATLTNAAVERHVGTATNRNLNVLRELAHRWG
jgi:uncharacterized protein (DUF1697 family)